MPETMDAADRHKRSQEHLEKADDISSQINSFIIVGVEIVNPPEKMKKINERPA